jgi:hypothetical protein
VVAAAVAAAQVPPVPPVGAGGAGTPPGGSPSVTDGATVPSQPAAPAARTQHRTRSP